MENQLFEMHLHTAEVSPCGSIPASEIVPLLKDSGYQGVVVTDHLFPELADSFGAARWQDTITFCLSGYQQVKALASSSLIVLLGVEIRLRENNNDYLLYGASEELLREKSDLLDLSLSQLIKWVRHHNMLLIQAHPFRSNMTVMPVEHLDGIEVFNGNMRHDSNNDIATAWAKKYNLLGTSSSDFHEYEDLAQGGIYFTTPVDDEKTLVTALKNREYYLK